MLTYSYSDLVDFINNQPDDKSVNFNELDSGDDCGCLLVHFAKSKNLNNFSCGYGSIESYPFDITLAKPIEEDSKKVFKLICTGEYRKITSYKQLKEIVNIVDK